MCYQKNTLPHPSVHLREVHDFAEGLSQVPVIGLWSWQPPLGEILSYSGLSQLRELSMNSYLDVALRHGLKAGQMALWDCALTMPWLQGQVERIQTANGAAPRVSVRLGAQDPHAKLFA